MTDFSTRKEIEKENEVFRLAFHYINTHAAITMRSDKVSEMIGAICNWSYAHRAGNGELTDIEQQKLIDSCFNKIKKLVQNEK